jgi:hypothetical protein
VFVAHTARRALLDRARSVVTSSVHGSEAPSGECAASPTRSRRERTSDLAVHAPHLRAHLGLPLPDQILRVLLLEHRHETHGERRSAAPARRCSVLARSEVTSKCASLRFCRRNSWLSCIVTVTARHTKSSRSLYLGDFLASPESFRHHDSRWRTQRAGIQSRASHARVFRSRDVSERDRGPEGTRSRLPPRLGRAPARPPNPKRDIRGDARLCIVQTRNAPPRTPRARASRLDRALTSPPAPTHRPSRLRRDSSTSGARRWYVSRARAARGSGTKPPRGAARPRLVSGCAHESRPRRETSSALVFRPTHNRNTRAPPDPPPPPPARRTP